MSPTDHISWPVLRRIARDALGEAIELTGVRPLHGGSMSTTLLLNLRGKRRLVLKIAPHLVMHQYEHEAYQLNMLRESGLPAPEVLACRVASLDDPNSYILMEYLSGEPLAKVRADLSAEEFDHLEMHLAEIVLAIHGRCSRTYSRLTREGDGRTSDFPSFFHVTYDPIVRDLIDLKAVGAPLRRRLSHIHAKVDALLVHEDRPRLIHGDLWASNLLVSPDRQGKWWITGLLDPNCRYSHAESELAYLELFKTVTPAFFRVYQQVLPVSAEYRAYRRDVYMLYTLMNHVRLFGDQYAKPLAAVAERVARTVSSSRRRSVRRVA